MPTLVLVRHGQSAWNLENRFTGWWDVDLSSLGEQEARQAGRLLAQQGFLPDVAYTSLLTRAIRTLNILQEETNRLWARCTATGASTKGTMEASPVLTRRRLATATAKSSSSFGAAAMTSRPRPWSAVGLMTSRWMPRYVPGVVPATECLADVVVRMVPYWYDAIAPELLAGKVVLVAAHGNSLRALIKHLDQMSGEDIAKLEIPTGVPIVYQLDEALQPLKVGGQWLGDPEAIAAAAEAVRKQGQRA